MASLATNERALPKVGYEIKGIDLARGLSKQDFNDQVLTPLHQNSAIVLRDQQLDPATLVEFASKLGKLETHVFTQHLLPGVPQILHLSNIEEDGKAIGRKNPGEFWHTDLTYTKTPNRYSILYAVEIPHDEAGIPLGNTLFRSTIAAYATLSPEAKEKLFNLEAKHFHLWVRRRRGDEAGIELSAEQRQKMEDVVHPVVCRHSESGRNYLFVNHAHTVAIQGMSVAESDEILDGLYRHIANQETYHHRWKVGDVVIWDNHTTQHFATCDYQYPQRRRMWRLSVEGCQPQRATAL